MRYSYEFKRKCVEMYRQGTWPETPEGIKNPHHFHAMIRKWNNIELANSTDALKHNSSNKKWSPEEKLVLVSQVIAGKSINSVACSLGISDGMLYQWVRKYKILGYNGLINQPKGRKSKDSKMKKNINTPRKLEESEYEELIRLRAENAYIKAENEVIKKRIALRQEKEAARLKAKKQQSSKNSAKKDIS